MDGRLLVVVWLDFVVLDHDDRLPPQPPRIPHRKQPWLAHTVEGNVEPVVLLKARRRPVLVGRERHGGRARSPLDLDEPRLPARGIPGEDVEPSVLGLDALRLATVLTLVAYGEFHRDPLHLRVRD